MTKNKNRSFDIFNDSLKVAEQFEAALCRRAEKYQEKDEQDLFILGVLSKVYNQFFGQVLNNLESAACNAYDYLEQREEPTNANKRKTKGTKNKSSC